MYIDDRGFRYENWTEQLDEIISLMKSGKTNVRK
jgi:hypothetical protein